MAAGDRASRGPDEYAVADDDHLAHKQRLRSLHRSRQEALDIRREVAVSRVAGDVSREDALVAYRETVEVFALDARQVLTSNALSFDEDPWTEQELGSLTIGPPTDLQQRAREQRDRLHSPPPTQTETVFEGISDLLSAPRPQVTESWRVRIGDDVVEASASEPVPQSVLDTALQTIDDALQDAEIGVSVAGKDKTKQLGVGENGGEWPWDRDDVVLPHETEGSP